MSKMKHSTEDTISIRTFREDDIYAVMDVVSDAAFSHVWPGFLLTVKKKTFQLSSVLLATVLYLCTQSKAIFTCAIIASYCLVYAFNWAIAIYYLYGPPLKDMKCVSRSYFSDGNSCFWVAEHVGGSTKIVGTIAIVNNSPYPVDGTEAWLRRMAVHRRYRGRGIGGRLIQTAIDFCRQRNYKKIRLITTDVHVQARQLYQKYGFICKSYKPIFYLNGLFPIWTFEFEKYL